MRWCIGYGSLVSESSARESVPELQNFGLYYLHGHARIFGKVNPHCILRGTEDRAAHKYASVFVKEKPLDRPIIVCAFQVPEESWLNLRQRECDYEETEVQVTSINDPADKITATIYRGYEDDQALLDKKGQGFDKIYAHWPEFRRKYDGPVYRKDIYPTDTYLNIVAGAYKQAGHEAYENFLQTTFLADETTSIHEYLETR